MPVPEIDLTVYPDECDAFGHLNQASFLTLFERARWEMLARGPGMDVFTRAGAWPAVRKTVIDYHAAAFPGDVLRFTQTLTHHGRTSFTMRQTARRLGDDTLIATAEFVFVCIARDGKPVPVPDEVGRFMNARGGPPGDVHRLTVNGVNLAVDVRGEGACILFIHGYPLDRTLWQYQLSHLAGCRRVAPDLRGMGLSDAPDLGYSMTTYAQDLAALLDVLGVDDAVLCGLSMGGYVAFEFLRRWPARVRGLVLMDTRAEADSADGRRARDAQAAQLREGGPSVVADAMLPQLLADPDVTHSPVAARVRRIIAAAPVAGLAGALAAMRDRPDSTDLLAALECIPTLVVSGDRDRIIPADRAREMAGRIPGARVEIIAGAGHLPPLERPAETTAVLGAFLAGLDARRPPPTAGAR
jgi:YbgC/YbaW family acyl-CoA thioester hydrolase